MKTDACELTQATEQTDEEENENEFGQLVVVTILWLFVYCEPVDDADELSEHGRQSHFIQAAYDGENACPIHSFWKVLPVRAVDFLGGSYDHTNINCWWR